MPKRKPYDPAKATEAETILAACVHSNRELATLAELQHQGFRAYVPCETLDRIVMGRKHRHRRPAFPGYVFVEIPPDRDLAEVRALESVYGFVGVTGLEGVRRPAIIPRAQLRTVFLAELFGVMDFTRQPESWKPGLGERVRVKATMFRGYIGKVLRMSNKEAWIAPEKGGELRVRLEELEAAA